MRVRHTIAAALLALSACSPPVYHEGARDDHFTGTRFFNPDGEQGTGGAQNTTWFQYMQRNLWGRHTWPASVPVTPTVPPARVAGPGMRVTWIGHSSVLVQADGLNILTDPVWAERASPVQFAGPKRVRQPGIRLADLPKIDLILISHDHYDHMDMTTLKTLLDRDKPLIVTGLGNDVRLAGEGIAAQGRDWGQSVAVRPGVSVRLDRVHHWSARSLRDRDATLWTGFTVTLPHGDLYFAGDTGPGNMSWIAEGHRLRPPRFAILPIGAIHYNEQPSGNHIAPAQAMQAFLGLHAGYALGVHWGTFELTDEPIDLPPRLLARAVADAHLAPDRFRVLEPGIAWQVPPLTPAAQSSAKPPTR